jgi:hypothetical protein
VSSADRRLAPGGFVNTSIGRSGVRRAVLLGASAMAVTATAACSSASPAEQAAASSSAALSAAAEAAPGTYGEPVDPLLPNPTDVATDAPVPVASTGASRVSIVYADWTTTSGAVEVGGFVGGVVESDGTCTLTLTQGSTSVTASLPGEPDATSTSCAGLEVPGAQLAPGTWTAVVTYESSTSRGESPAVEVQVP